MDNLMREKSESLRKNVDVLRLELLSVTSHMTEMVECCTKLCHQLDMINIPFDYYKEHGKVLLFVSKVSNWFTESMCNVVVLKGEKPIIPLVQTTNSSEIDVNDDDVLTRCTAETACIPSPAISISNEQSHVTSESASSNTSDESNGICDTGEYDAQSVSQCHEIKYEDLSEEDDTNDMESPPDAAMDLDSISMNNSYHATGNKIKELTEYLLVKYDTGEFEVRKKKKKETLETKKFLIRNFGWFQGRVLAIGDKTLLEKLRDNEKRKMENEKPSNANTSRNKPRPFHTDATDVNTIGGNGWKESNANKIRKMEITVGCCEPKKLPSQRSGMKSRNRKFHHCLFCKKSFKRIIRHFLSTHKQESRVREILNISNKTNRDWALRALGNKGDYLYCQSNTSECCPVRKPLLPSNSKKYINCKYCFTRIRKYYWYRHSKLCQERLEETSLS